MFLPTHCTRALTATGFYLGEKYRISWDGEGITPPSSFCLVASLKDLESRLRIGGSSTLLVGGKGVLLEALYLMVVSSLEDVES